MKIKNPLPHVIIAIFSIVIIFSSEISAQCPSCNGGAAPANDACTGATNLGPLNAPIICPIGTGIAQTFNGTNVCATAEFPYGYIIGCQTGGDMAAPAADVWYRFQITGTVLNVQITSALRGVSLGLWQDPGTGCDDLVARNCAQTTIGGNITASFTSLNPGVYYLQISGADTLDQCTFSLTLTNNDDCTACIQQNNLTVSPPPVNGRYQAGTTVTFTYIVSDYNQTATNWIHGIVPHFGNGWDLSTLTGLNPAQSCDPVNGSWLWFNGVVTGTFRPISDGPGFFFESGLGCAAACDPNNPGDNYGDQGVSAACPLTFQWTVTTLASCSPATDNLNIEIFNYGDSETGSWTSTACETDPNYRFFAQLFCCDSSIITIQDVSCFGANDGSCNVLGRGFPPYDYELLDLSGNVLQSQLGDSSDHTFTGLAGGVYQVQTTDENNCTSIQRITVLEPDELIVTGSFTNPLCNGDSNGTITTAVFGGTPPYRFFWDNGPTSSSLTDLIAGTYNVTVTDTNGCQAFQNFVVSEPLAFVGTISSVNIPCAGGTGTAVLLMSGGTSPYSYSWSNGSAASTIIVPAGNYSVTATDAHLCSFIDSVEILGGQSASNTIINAQICDGDSLFVGGEYQAQSGTYYDSLLTTAGCDSVIETRLAVLANLFTQIAASICQGDSFFVAGDFQTQSGLYYDTLISAAGCDSVVETSLTVDAVITNSITASICDGESYFAGGAFQTQPGTYYDTFSTTSGCDSVLTTELLVLPVTTGNLTATICEGESYFVGGGFQTEAGLYIDTLIGSNGCDSILTTELIVSPITTGSLTATICEGESYFVGGGFQTEAGFYIDTLIGSNGCDSILTTELIVSPITTGNLTATICEGESYFVGGGFQTEAGFYIDTITSSNGCDSILTTELIVSPITTGNLTATICEGESYFVGGGFQTEAGFYIDTITSSNGCDSILTTELIVSPITTGNLTATICEGESYFVGGGFQTEAGFYVDTLIGSNGCDSILTTELIVTPPSPGNTQVTICFGDSVFVGGDFQTEKGSYIDTLSASNGCDSILTTEVLVTPLSQGSAQVSICEGESYFVGGGLQTQNGFYVDTLTNAASTGCDSILTTELIIISPVLGSASVSICSGDSYFVGGADQTQAGFYVDTLVASSGCDSILTTELILIPPSQGSAQVSICDGDSYFIGGANQTEAGFYIDTLFDAASNGCDSVLTTELIVIPTAFGNISASICDGESYFVGGGFQTEAGFYIDTLAGSNGCDSILTTALIVLPNSSSTQNIDICNGDSFLAGGAFQTTSGTYYDTLTSSNGCDSIVITNLNVGAALRVNFDVNEVSCCPGGSGSNGGGGSQECAMDLLGLPHGTIITNQFASQGITVTGVSNSSSRPDAVAIFNSDLTNTTHDDLEVGIGNLLVLPDNLTDSNNDGIIDNLTDSPSGGTIAFTFDRDRTVVSITLADNDRSGTVIRAYDSNNNLLLTVPAPAPNLPVNALHHEIYTLNLSGVRRVEVYYTYKLGVTALILDCSQALPSCELDLSALAHGTILTNQLAPQGVTITGNSNRSALYPDSVAIFNSNVTGSLDPDLELGIGNLLILPEFAADTNGDGILDRPGDSGVGGQMTFNFDKDRTVFSITLVDNDRNNGTIKAYDLNNNLILSVSTPSGAPSSIQVYTLNISGVRRLEVSYVDSRGVTALMLDCPTVCCDGNVTANTTGGFPPYQYSWSTGSTTAYSGDSLCVGTYGVTVTDALGCTATDSVGLVNANVTEETAQICDGDSILLEGAYQTEAGFYYDTLGVTNGCFEILKTQLIVLPLSHTTLQAQICEGQSYFAGGAFQTESGTYIDTFIAANGCDSILTTGLIVFPAPVTQFDAEICEGESYFAGGAFQTEAGTYFDTLTSLSGCDSIVVTLLNVLPISSENVSAEICEGQSYFAGGAFQTEAGTYFDTLTSSLGCDSILITTLEVKPKLTEDVAASICEGESYFAGGAFQTESGTYFDTLASAGGCDSVVATTLNVLPVLSENISAQICDGESYFAGGEFQTESGTYFDTLTSSLGCDSIVITTLNILPALSENIAASICEGESYFVGGAFQTVSGIYFDTLASSNGCDSIVETNLAVLPAPVVNVNAQICQGDSFFIGGAFQTESGIYMDTFAASSGCDSIVETTLSVLSELIENVSAEICDGESYFVGGAFQTEAGTYFDTLISSSGCDSIVATNLNVILATVTSVSAQICSGDSFFVGGAFQTQQGIYSDTLASAAGCDSIVETALTVLAELSEIVSAEICEGESYFAGGGFQTEAGIYYDTLVGSTGCDSVLITNLIINPVYQLVEQAQICIGDSFFVGGAFQTESGTYIDNYSTQFGCDSIVITELMVLQQIIKLQDASICEGDSLFAGGAFQTTSGIYIDTTISSGGCDSITVTNLTVSPSSTTNRQVSICEGDSFLAGGAFQTQSGIYTDTFASSAGCDSIIITELSVTQINISTQSLTDASCFGSENGEISISVDGGEEPYALAWSTGQTQQGLGSSVITGITGLVAGSYGVTVTDNSGCTSSASFSIDEPGPLALGAVTTPVSCNGGSDATIDLTVLGGTPSYTFAWATGETTEDISNRPAGFDTVIVTDANNCSATVIVQVTQPPAIPNTVFEVQICEGDSYLAGGALQTESGTYFDTLANSEGCDSILETELIVLPAATSIVQAAICEGESFFAGGEFQTDSGTYYDTLTASNACDSIIITELTVYPALGAVILAEICQGESYLAGGAFQTESGTYYDTLTGTSGCDSVIVTELSVNAELTTNIEVVICEGDSFFVAGGYQTIGGIYHDSLTAAAGCDSIVITNLIVNPARLTGIEAVICSGDSIFAGGAYQTEEGTYYDTLQTAAGCDSILAWDVFVLTASDSTVQVSICEGEFYFAGGGFQNLSGTYYDTLLSLSGCDSVVTTVLSVNPHKFTGIEALICEGDSIFVGGDYQTAEGTYYDTLQTSAGCDSILTWDLFVLPASLENVQATICEGEFYFAGGGFQTESGTYFDTLTNVQGCDSIVITDLTVLINSSSFVIVQICQGDSIFLGGAYQTQSGEYVDTLVSSNGCDSIRSTQLSVLSTIALGAVPTNLSCNGVPDGSIDLFVLGGVLPLSYSWSPTGETTEDINGLAAGFYTVVVTDADGCQATNITLVTEPDSLSVSADFTNDTGANDGAIDLTVSGGTAPYNFLWSNGNTSEDLTGLGAGSYSVTITDDNGCNLIATFDVLAQLQKSLKPQFEIKVSPNPFNELLLVELESKDAGNGWIVLRDLLGREVMMERIEILSGTNKYELRMDQRLSTSTYLLEVVKSDSNHRAIKAIVKE